jgi:hypothetical protein
MILTEQGWKSQYLIVHRSKITPTGNHTMTIIAAHNSTHAMQIFESFFPDDVFISIGTM